MAWCGINEIKRPGVALIKSNGLCGVNEIKRPGVALMKLNGLCGINDRISEFKRPVWRY